MKINEVAKLTGVTVRTLHYYDEIGLLKPSEVTDVGYRFYDDNAIESLQQIMFFKELDFPLVEIKEIMQNPNYDKNLALLNHKKLLVEKKLRLDELIKLVDKTMKGLDNMSFKEFDNTNIEKQKNKYRDEVKARWGNTAAFVQSEEKAKSYDSQKWSIINSECDEILKEFSRLVGTNPESEEAMALVEKWQQYISDNFYDCTKEILSCLGQMYISDERFTENIDKNVKGTAEFMSKAINAFCE